MVRIKDTLWISGASKHSRSYYSTVFLQHKLIKPNLIRGLTSLFLDQKQTS